MEYGEVFIIAGKCVFVEVGLGFVHMLQEESRVQIALDSSSVWHMVPALAQFFLTVVVCQMIILAGSDFCIYSHYTVQPA